MDQLQWKKIFEIIADFSIPSPDQNPEVLLADELEKEFPSDRGLSVMELRDNIPYCIRWPDFASSHIKIYNSYYCYIAPQIYNTDKHIIYPVIWSDYDNSEFNKGFNVPLNIGYTTGFGITDRIKHREIIFCLHKSIESRGFTNKEIQLLTLIQPLIQSIFNMREQLYYRNLEAILPREVASGCKPLSTREREIMEYLIGRESMKDIALKLGISQRTVETHALHIYQKLCVCSRRELQRFLVH